MWKVEEHETAGQIFYKVFRMVDGKEVWKALMDSAEEAQKLADWLNERKVEK